MTATELGACEWFVWDLRRSNLIDRGQLDQVVGEFLKRQPLAEPPALAQYLVEHDVLTPFQAERLLQGKTQGLVLGPYTIMDALGAGSMGTVYKALSRNDKQWYAVKVLPRRSMWNVRIARRQVRAFEQCRHPAVVPFVDVGTAGGTHFLVWQLVEGETLDRLVEREGPLPPGEAACYALQAAEGLDACHQQNLAHGLLKPSNLMIRGNHQVAILDFGIGSLLANTEGESLVDTMSTANTMTSGLDCASPECIMDPTKRTPAGDQYSLGCTLYYLLTGQYPFPQGSAVEKMMAHQTLAAKPVRQLRPEVPDELAAVVERLMQKAPQARYANMLQVIEVLRPLASPVALLPPRAPAARGGRGSAPGVGPAPGVGFLTPPPRGGRGSPDLAPPAALPSGVPAATPAQTPVLPTRTPVRDPLGRTPVREPLTRTPLPPAAPAPTPPPAPAEPPDYDPPWRPRRSLEERLGPIGLVLGAILAAAATWLLTSTFFK